MAQAVATLTVSPHPFGVDNTQHRQILNGICGLTAGGTYVTLGIPLPWITMVDGVGRFMPQSTATQPFLAFFFSQLGSGYGYVFDTVHNTLRIFNGGNELVNAAAIVADTIGFEAEYIRGF